jgi:hypothetical protein
VTGPGIGTDATPDPTEPTVEAPADIPSDATTDQRYLAGGLAWLRARLTRLAGPAAATAIARESALGGATSTALVPTGPEALLAAALRASNTPLALPAPGETAGSDGSAAEDERIATAAATMAAAASAEPPPALVTLAARLGLSPFEEQVLLLCVAMELDPGLGALCAAAQDDPSASHPTFALAFELFDDPAWDVVTPGRPLRYWRLIEISQPAGRPLTRSVLRADERIVSLAKGMNYLDDRIEPLFPPVAGEFDPAMLAPTQQTLVDDVLRRLRRADGPAPIVNLVGPDGITKTLLGAAIAWTAGRRLHAIGADLLPSGSDDLETLARLWDRESLLLPIALLVDAHDLDPAATDGPARQVARFLSRSDGLVFLASRERWTKLPRASVTVDALRPAASEQRDGWRDQLVKRSVADDAADAAARSLAGQFRLDLPQINAIVDAVVEEGGPELPELRRELWSECLAHSRPRLDVLAQRVDVRPSWDDFVLAEPQLSLLHQLSHQVADRTTVYETWGFAARMNRGLGISALFAGASGTGKSMAAEVIAAELRLDLYRIDLSAVVSKYIGETEKNLRRLFDAAEDGGALLFFDEADALFGKRSEVKDSHDRYANIEVNYLLQRMESYRGLAILATNMRSALDTAFVRRIRFIVEFPFPALAERRMMWQKVLPAAAPRDQLDWDRLASLPTTGGMIHSVALNAAFMAAHRGEPVSMSMLLDAAKTEFRKQELPILERDFAWVEPAVAPPAAPTDAAPTPAAGVSA